MRTLTRLLTTPLLFFAAPALQAQVAPTASGWGPHAPAWVEYKFDAALDPDVLDDRPTELWARLYYPASAIVEPVARPLIVLKHGNHGTCGTGEDPRYDFDCTYTDFGYCPMDHVVVPSHAGYEYFADRLASHGYLVLSINSNRGITCGNGFDDDFGLNLARGRLILRHLELLAQWANAALPQSMNPLTPGVAADAATSFGPPTIDPLPFDLSARVDFEQVGLFGHSRGGEGCRAALHELTLPGSMWPARITAISFTPESQTTLDIRAIFELGAVDGQAGVELNAENVAWCALLPACDGDVWFQDSIRVFDRMMQGTETRSMPKATYFVLGMCANFFNTEFQVPESPGCGDTHQPLWSFDEIESIPQQTVARSAVMSFFRAFVGRDANPAFARHFDPLYDPPAEVTDLTEVQRGWISGHAMGDTIVIAECDGPMGDVAFAVTNATLEFGNVPLDPNAWGSHHAPSLIGASISWPADGMDPPMITAERDGMLPPLDLTSYDTLDMRVGRQHVDAPVAEVLTPLDFSISLIKADGTTTPPVPISDYDQLVGPYTGPSWDHPLMHTVRIPLADFGAPLDQVRGVRFDFDRSAAGDITVASIRAARDILAPAPCAGDVDGDGETGLSDFAILAANFGLMGASRSDGDLDDDGYVGLSDFTILAGGFGCTP